MQHLSEAQLNDYVDGVLDERAYAAAEEHVRECSACAAEVASLRALLETARVLPLSLEPPAHLWSAVRRETIARRFHRRHVLWELRVPLAAAALALITTASGLTWWLGRAGNGSSALGASAVQAALPTGTLGLARAEAGYLDAARTLLLVLEERRDRLDPAIVETVEENLRVMNTAIANAKAALEADPLNQDVAAILNATYQSKVQMLQRALRLSGET